jgi:F-type H+-transporting ATPase subunit a
MIASPLATPVVFHLGPVGITQPVVTTWGIIVVLALASFVLTRRLAVRPSRRQAAVEIVVDSMLQQIGDTMRVDARPYLPLLGSLFLFLVVANLCGMVPGVRAPTAHLETTAALAFIVFCSTQYYGIRRHGVLGYLKSFTQPTPIMAPLNFLAEITRTFSLMVRLFGNIMSGEFVIGIVIALAGLFFPVPLMLLEVLTGLVQAYIFTILASVFIGGAVGNIERG